MIAHPREQQPDAGPVQDELGPGEQLRYMQFYKTSQCRYFQRGTCRMGAACSFAHGHKELRTRPDLTKTSLCEKWLLGCCPLSADACGFAHGDGDRRVTPLFYKTMLCRMHGENGRACPNGEHCCHAHTEQELAAAWQRQVESGVVDSVEAGTSLQKKGPGAKVLKTEKRVTPVKGEPAMLHLEQDVRPISSSVTLADTVKLLQLLEVNNQLVLQRVRQVSLLGALLESGGAQPSQIAPSLPAAAYSF